MRLLLYGRTGRGDNTFALAVRTGHEKPDYNDHERGFLHVD